MLILDEGRELAGVPAPGIAEEPLRSFVGLGARCADNAEAGLAMLVLRLRLGVPTGG